MTRGLAECRRQGRVEKSFARCRTAGFVVLGECVKKVIVQMPFICQVPTVSCQRPTVRCFSPVNFMNFCSCLIDFCIYKVRIAQLMLAKTRSQFLCGHHTVPALQGNAGTGSVSSRNFRDGIRREGDLCRRATVPFCSPHFLEKSTGVE